jgi:autotransporter adhesin
MKKILTSLIVVGGIIGSANAAVNAPTLFPNISATPITDIVGGGDTFDSTKPVEQLYTGLTGIAASESWNSTTLGIINSMGQGLDSFLAGANNAFGGFVGEVNGAMQNFATQVNDADIALDDKIEKQGKELSGGIAAANALTGLDNHLDAGNRYSIGIGAGYYNSQAAMALGGVVRTGDAHAINAGVSVGTQGQLGAKAGWNMQF